MWKPGQELVCINDGSMTKMGGVDPPLVKGKIYHFRDYRINECCGTESITVEEVKVNQDYNGYNWCKCGKLFKGNSEWWWMNKSRFRALQYDHDVMKKLANAELQRLIPNECEVIRTYARLMGSTHSINV